MNVYLGWAATAGAFFSGTSVILGAFVAHSLSGHISEQHLKAFETAVRYQMYHGLALLVIFLAANQVKFRGAPLVAALLIVGVCLFSGSLYVLTLSGVKKLGVITPIGGLALIAGWSILFTGLLSAYLQPKSG